MYSTEHSSLFPQAKYAERRNWPRVLQALKMAAERVNKLAQGESEPAAADADAPADADAGKPASRGAKRRRTLSPELRDAWRQLSARAEAVERQLGRAVTAEGAEGAKSVPVFAFVEGALVAALRAGTWLLLDEVNLAPVETLERLASVMEVRVSAASPPGPASARDTFEPGAAAAVPCRVECSRRVNGGSPLTAPRALL